MSKSYGKANGKEKWNLKWGYQKGYQKGGWSVYSVSGDQKDEADKEEDKEEDEIAQLFADEDAFMDSLGEKAEDAKIIYHVILGHDLTEVYSNERLQVAHNRHMISQLAAVDMSEVFSPERVTKLCK